MHLPGLAFDVAVPRNGYRWWYLDGLSGDARFGITVIGFIGSVFSPYYAWARRRRDANPYDHCAINVALYGRGVERWCMTERGARRLRRDARTLQIGGSSFNHRDGTLTLHIDERGAPLPYRIRGEIRLRPRITTQQAFALDAQAQHHWSPLAPLADIEVALSQPALAWRGTGYMDSNWGSAPLEDAFESWSWTRSVEPARCQVHYDVQPRGAAARSLSVLATGDGVTSCVESASMCALPASRWAIARPVRVEADATPSAIRTLQDAPFYCRSLIETGAPDRRRRAIHESLNLNRFRSPWIQAMLPFRMPRLP